MKRVPKGSIRTKLCFISLLILNASLFTPCTAQESNLFSFADTNGIYPKGSLLLSNGMLYGMTSYGGLYNNGCIFSMDTNFTAYHDLFDFYDTLGSTPYGSLTRQPAGTRLFGMASEGGKYNKGVIFSIDTGGTGYKTLYNFNDTAGAYPSGSLLLAGNILYGMTDSGGTYHAGCIFSCDTSGNGYRLLHTFNDTAGAYPAGSLLLSDSVLYGMTAQGGAYDSGCLFALAIRHSDSAYRILHTFSDGIPFVNDTDGAIPQGSLLLSGKRLYGMTAWGGKSFEGNIFAIDTDGNRYANLFNFSDTSGTLPQGSLLLNGKILYGMTSHSGINGFGSIFSLDTNGHKFKYLLYFNSFTGAFPFGNLVAGGSALFGMTAYGGASNAGVIFRIDTNAVYYSSIPNLTLFPSAINVFPNPCNGIFTIQVKSEGRNVKNIQIYNVFGEQVYSKSYQPSANGYSQRDTFVQPIAIDLSSQPNGIYFLRLLSADGALIANTKIIIQK